MNYNVGCRMTEIDNDLLEKIRTSMKDTIAEYGEDVGSAFDLAVDIAYDLELAREPHFEIPVYVVEIAESIMGKDNPNEQ